MITDILAEIEQVQKQRKLFLQEKEAEIRRLMEIYENMAAPFNDRIAALEEQCKGEVRAFGKPFENPFVKITYKRPYDRANWDSDQLNQFAKQYPEILTMKKISHIGEFFKFEYKTE